MERLAQLESSIQSCRKMQFSDFIFVIFFAVMTAHSFLTESFFIGALEIAFSLYLIISIDKMGKNEFILTKEKEAYIEKMISEEEISQDEINAVIDAVKKYRKFYTVDSLDMLNQDIESNETMKKMYLFYCAVFIGLFFSCLFVKSYFMAGFDALFSIYYLFRYMSLNKQIKNLQELKQTLVPLDNNETKDAD